MAIHEWDTYERKSVSHLDMIILKILNCNDTVWFRCLYTSTYLFLTNLKHYPSRAWFQVSMKMSCSSRFCNIQPMLAMYAFQFSSPITFFNFFKFFPCYKSSFPFFLFIWFFVFFTILFSLGSYKNIFISYVRMVGLLNLDWTHRRSHCGLIINKWRKRGTLIVLKIPWFCNRNEVLNTQRYMTNLVK